MKLIDCSHFMYKIVGSLHPELLWKKILKQSKNIGLERLYLIVSFDCDVPEDAQVVLNIEKKLSEIGIKSSFAVPGEILLRDKTIYGELRDRGVEFLNHGYTRHTFWNEKFQRNESCFFYDQLSIETIRQDIYHGHETLVDFLSKSPFGFRTPHFGTFQKRKDLIFLYGVLSELGYRYSSSTTPYFGFRYGPVFFAQNVFELPVTGVFTRPLHIYDTWGFFDAPDRVHLPNDYVNEAKKAANFFSKQNQVGILNCYADPAVIANASEFFEAMKVLASISHSIYPNELVSTLAKHSLLSYS
jgi:hypothetical protein